MLADGEQTYWAESGLGGRTVPRILGTALGHMAFFVCFLAEFAFDLIYIYIYMYGFMRPWMWAVRAVVFVFHTRSDSVGTGMHLAHCNKNTTCHYSASTVQDDSCLSNNINYPLIRTPLWPHMPNSKVIQTWYGVTEDAEAEHRRWDTPRPVLRRGIFSGPVLQLIAPVYSGVPPCRESRGAKLGTDSQPDLQQDA